MTRWCPLCETPGRPVVSGSLSMSDVKALEAGVAVRVRERLPGIVPSHMCSRCPTFFRSRDRFYLTARREEDVHGIAVWPHRQARVRIELVGDGLVFLFGDTTWLLIEGDDFSSLLSDFFWGRGQREIIAWSRRRGFAIGLSPNGNGRARFRVDPTGPHFVLLVAKAWAQENELRSGDIAIDTLEAVGANPLVFGPPGVHS